MRTDDMTLAQIKWLNRQFSNSTRNLNKLVQRFHDLRCPKDDPVYAAMRTAVDALFAVCAATHKRIVELEPKLPDPYKPSSYMRQRLATLEEEAMQRARSELGQ